jgi:hypothetical protein
MPAAEFHDLGPIHIPAAASYRTRRPRWLYALRHPKGDRGKWGRRVVDAPSHLVSQRNMFDYSTACHARRRLPALVLTGHGSAMCGATLCVPIREQILWHPHDFCRGAGVALLESLCPYPRGLLQEEHTMKVPSGASRSFIRVLVADTNQTQSQLPSSALRRQPPLFPDAMIEQMRAYVPAMEEQTISGTTHYTIVMGNLGATRIADLLDDFAHRCQPTQIAAAS